MLAFDEAAAAEFARIKSEREGLGKVMGPYDMQIAGHAIATARRLITRNGKEFSRIQRLDWEDWEQEAG